MTNRFYGKMALLGLTTALAGGIAQEAGAVTFHTGSGSIDGSLCVGLDCSSSESFGFDTLRLKENNLRLHFDDTSVSASFPRNDWRLVANDSANGGANMFAIEDATAGRRIAVFEAAAPANSLYVDNSGRLGLGTANPVVELHVVDGDTPTLRLEQDGSSGFTAHTWDMAGNETNFFIRDVTNGSKLPFRIQPGAETNSVYIANDGNVGMGTTSPDAKLDVTAPTDDVVAAIIQGAGIKVVDLVSTNNNAVQWRLQSNSGNRRFLARNAAGATETQVILGNNSIVLAGPTDSSDTWATISAAGIVTNIGSCTSGTPCDAVFDPDVYQVPSIDDHAAKMWSNKHLPAVGPTRQGDAVNVTAKMTGMLNELEHAHIFIQQLHERLTMLEETTQGSE